MSTLAQRGRAEELLQALRAEQSHERRLKLVMEALHAEAQEGWRAAKKTTNRFAAQPRKG